MAGREKISVFEYSLEGKFLRKFDSITEVRDLYFPEDNGKRPLFLKKELGKEYEFLEGSILFKERVYRDDVVYIIRIISSIFCTLNKTEDKCVQVFNIKNEYLAEFKNVNILCKMMPQIALTSVFHQLNSRKGTKRFHGASEFIFKYKEYN